MGTQSSLLALLPSPKITPAQFEQIWMRSEISAVAKDIIATVPTPSTASEIGAAMSKSGVAMMASSPPQNNVIKFYFYAQEAASGAYHLVEATLELDSRTFSANIKSTAPENAPVFAAVIREALAVGHLIEM